MSITTNEQLLKAFVEGKRVGKVNNLTIDGDKLLNYRTVIAERTSDGLTIVNSTKYSATTSKIQSKLKSLIPSDRLRITMAHVPMGHQGTLTDRNPVIPSFYL